MRQKKSSKIASSKFAKCNIERRTYFIMYISNATTNCNCNGNLKENSHFPFTLEVLLTKIVISTWGNDSCNKIILLYFELQSTIAEIKNS